MTVTGMTTPETDAPDAFLYRTTGKQDEAFFQEIKWKIINPAYKVRCAVLIAVFALISVAYWRLTGMRWMMLAAVAYAAVVALQYVRGVNRTVRRSVGRLREMTPSGEIQLTTSCAQDGIRSENGTMGGVVTLPYDAFVRAAETERYLLLVSRERAAIPFFKESLSAEEVEGLRELIRQRCPKVRL